MRENAGNDIETMWKRHENGGLRGFCPWLERSKRLVRSAEVFAGRANEPGDAALCAPLALFGYVLSPEPLNAPRKLRLRPWTLWIPVEASPVGRTVCRCVPETSLKLFFFLWLG